MRVDPLLEQIHRLKLELDGIERQLAETNVPVPVLEDFKSAIDQVRLTLWGILQSSSSDTHHLASAITRFRIRRAGEICRQIVSDIDAHHIPVELPELTELNSALYYTSQRIDQLRKTGM
ncbi:MAG: hypothetical protein L0212_12340 [Acidobacteria bacterium]|nr:hypothetical protein [Acidobacteriota bacterium]